MITPDQGSTGIQEEQEVGVTPTRTRMSESAGVYTPASSPSELGSILSASDDDSRPVTKREIELVQVRIKGMFSNLRAALNDEVQRRDTIDALVAGQIETLTSQMSALKTQLQFQQGALANSRDQAERQGDDIFKMMNDLHDTIANMRSTPATTNAMTAGVPQTQPTRPTLVPGTSLLREVIHADAEDSLDARIESLHEAITASMSDLRGQVLTVNDQLSARV